MPRIKKYECKDVRRQLRGIAYRYLSERVKVIDDYHLIVMPKLLKWYRLDILAATHKKDGCKNKDTALGLIRAVHKV